jgi:hypothetical protein
MQLPSINQVEVIILCHGKRLAPVLNDFTRYL